MPDELQPCPHCHQSHPPGTSTCPVTGQPLICETCGSSLPLHGDECPNCGAILTRPIAQVTPVSPPVETPPVQAEIPAQEVEAEVEVPPIVEVQPTPPTDEPKQVTIRRRRKRKVTPPIPLELKVEARPEQLCPSCGKSNSTDAIYCIYCTYRLKEMPQEKKVGETPKKITEIPRVIATSKKATAKKRRWVRMAGWVLLGMVICSGLVCMLERMISLSGATPTAPTIATETFTPTRLPTPTFIPILPSSFLVDATSLYPALPIGGDSTWVLNERDTSIAPQLGDTGVWKKGNSADTGANEEVYYYTTVGNATVTWEMDQPFETGLYQIYVLDTKTNSAGLYQFNVLLDGSPATIYKGENAVIFQDTGQKADDWLAIGAYQIQGGQKLSIRLDIGPLDKTKPFAIDRLLIVKVSDMQKNVLDGLPAGRTLVSLLDDSRASFYELVEGKPVHVINRGVKISDELSWGGSFTTRDQTKPWLVPIWVDWQALGRLPSGTYELFVWLPSSHATVIADYALLADNNLVPRDNPAPLDQSAYHGEWVSLSTWKLDAEAAVGVRMVIEKGISGEIGVDAVAIVRVGE